MDQHEALIRISEMSALKPNQFQDGYDDMRREINYLLATVKAKIALLPQSR